MTKKKVYKSGEIADQKLKLQELNSKGKATKRDIVDVPKDKKIPPTTKKRHSYKAK